MDAGFRSARPGGAVIGSAGKCLASGNERLPARDLAGGIVPAKEETEKSVIRGAREELIDQRRSVAPGKRNSGRKELENQGRAIAELDQPKARLSGDGKRLDPMGTQWQGRRIFHGKRGAVAAA